MISADTVLASDCASEKKGHQNPKVRSRKLIPKFAPENFRGGTSKKQGWDRRNFQKQFSGSETYGISHKKPGRIDAVDHPKVKKQFTRSCPDKTKAKKSRTLKKQGAKIDKRAKQKTHSICPLYRAKTGSIFPLEEENAPRTRPP